MLPIRHVVSALLLSCLASAPAVATAVYGTFQNIEFRGPDGYYIVETPGVDNALVRSNADGYDASFVTFATGGSVTSATAGMNYFRGANTQIYTTWTVDLPAGVGKAIWVNFNGLIHATGLGLAWARQEIYLNGVNIVWQEQYSSEDPEWAWHATPGVQYIDSKYGINVLDNDVLYIVNIAVANNNYHYATSPTGPGWGYSEVHQSVTIPEPAAWASMIVGFGLIGFHIRRRAALGRIGAVQIPSRL